MTGTPPQAAQRVLDFWLGPKPACRAAALEARLRHWFDDPECRATIRDTFSDVVSSANAGKLETWEESPLGKLALVVVLDQFMRSYYGMTDARAFAHEKRAACTAVELTRCGVPASWSAEQHFTVLLPLGHSEDLEHQRLAVAESSKLVLRAPIHLRPIYEITTTQLVQFLRVIERFGRYPHRNEALGRESTAEELEFLRTWKVRHPVDAYQDRIDAAKEYERAHGMDQDGQA